jgi:hypothetical protein
VLASLIPGFRDVRSAFVAGSLLLASLYVLLIDTAEQTASDDHVGSGLRSLNNQIGDQGWLIVAGVAAYLLGSVFVVIRNLLVRNLSADALPHLTSVATLYERSRPRWLGALSPFSRPSLRRVGLLKSNHYDPGLAQAVCIDIIFGNGRRLQTASKELFDEYDRLRAEAQFRDSAILPGLIFLAVVMMNVDLSATFAAGLIVGSLVVAGILFVHARSLDREANSLYAHAIADGTVSAAILDQPERAGRRRRSK